MSVHLHPHLAIFWLIIIAAKLIAAVIVCIRPGRRRNFFFTAYILLWATRSAALYFLSYLNRGWDYTFVYWIGNGLLHGLAFATAYECFRQLFSPFRRLPRTFAYAFIIFAGLITTAATSMAYFFPSISATGSVATQNTIDRTLAVWICGLFWLLNFASDWLRIPWRTKIFGVGLGFLFSYSIDLFVTTVRSYTAWHLTALLWPIGFTTDLITVSLWIFYFTRKEPELTEPTPQDLEAIERALRLFRAAKSDTIRLSQ